MGQLQLCSQQFKYPWNCHGDIKVKLVCKTRLGQDIMFLCKLMQSQQTNIAGYIIIILSDFSQL